MPLRFRCEIAYKKQSFISNKFNKERKFLIYIRIRISWSPREKQFHFLRALNSYLQIFQKQNCLKDLMKRTIKFSFQLM